MTTEADVRAAFRSLRYRLTLAFGHDLSPDFLNRREVWRRHGAAIRQAVRAYEAGLSIAEEGGDTADGEAEVVIYGDALFRWRHPYSLAVSAAPAP